MYIWQENVAKKPNSFRLHIANAQCSNKCRDYRVLIDKCSRKIVIFFYDKHLQIFQTNRLNYSYSNYSLCNYTLILTSVL